MSLSPVYRPGQPPESSILRQIVTANFNQRFIACVDVSGTVWSYGLQMCRTQQERQEWMQAYAEHLEMLRSARVWSQVEPPI